MPAKRLPITGPVPRFRPGLYRVEALALLTLLIVSLLSLATPPVHAQWLPYQATNGLPTGTQNNYATPSPTGPSGSSLGVSGYGNAPQGGSTSITGPVTLTFQWAGAAGQPVMPLYVLLQGQSNMGGLAEGDVPTVSDGLGDMAIPDTPEGAA